MHTLWLACSAESGSGTVFGDVVGVNSHRDAFNSAIWGLPFDFPRDDGAVCWMVWRTPLSVRAWPVFSMGIVTAEGAIAVASDQNDSLGYVCILQTVDVMIRVWGFKVESKVKEAPMSQVRVQNQRALAVP